MSLWKVVVGKYLAMVTVIAIPNLIFCIFPLIIKLQVGKLTATCALTVQEKKLTGISLDKTALELSKGQSSEALKVIYTPADTTDDKTVTWSSADEKIATVKNGVVTAKATGTTKITATVEDEAASE